MPDIAKLSVAEIAAYSLLATAVIGAFFAGIVSVIQAWRSIVGKVESVAKDTAVVLGHVNSAATRDAAAIQAKDQQIALLRESLAKAESTAVALASANAVKPADTPKS